MADKIDEMINVEAIAAPRERQLWLKGQQLAFQAAMNGASLKDSLQPLVDTVIAHTHGYARAAFYAVPYDKAGLHLLAGMNDEYGKDVEDFKIGPDSLSCGLAMHTGEAVITADVTQEPRWFPLLSMAAKHNFRACWSFPIRTEGGPVLGTFAFYFEDPRTPDALELQMADVLGHAAAIIISRHKELEKRALSEQKLRNSEEKYRALFDSMDEGYCIIQMLYDDNGKAIDFIYLEVNRAFAYNNGLFNAEGKTIKELAPDIEHKWIDIYNNVAVTGVPIRFEESSTALSRIFSLFAFRIGRDEERKVAVIFTDITQRQNALAALHTSETRFRSLVKASAQLVFRMSADWQEMYTLTGKDFQRNTETINSNWIEMYIPIQDRPIVWKAIVDAIDKKKVFELEHRVLQSNGKIGWTLSRAVPIINEKGEITEWVGTAADITERKTAELKLQRFNSRLERKVAHGTLALGRTQELLQAALDSNPEMIQVLEALRDGNGKIIDFVWILNNATAERTLGNVIGRRLLDISPGTVTEGIFKAFVDVTETGIPQQYEKHYVHEQFNGWFFQSVVKLGDGVATNTIDITGRKLAEQQLLDLKAEQQREIFRATLASIEEERRRMAESLHNGLGQVLYGTKISLAGLVQDMPPYEFDQTKRYTTKLLDGAILESRRLSHELMPASLEEFGLKTAIEDICRQMEGDVEFSFKITGLKKRLEKYLELAIYRTIQELMLNVVKHAHATNAQVTVRISPTEALIRVSDNGCGIDYSISTRAGIGLSSIQSKIKLLNGQVTITSEPALGTIVKAIIPIPRQTTKS